LFTIIKDRRVHIELAFKDGSILQQTHKGGFMNVSLHLNRAGPPLLLNG